MKTITIIVEAGVVVDVIGLPENMDYKVCNHSHCKADQNWSLETCTL